MAYSTILNIGLKAKILHSDPGRVEFMYNGDD